MGMKVPVRALPFICCPECRGTGRKERMGLEHYTPHPLPFVPLCTACLGSGINPEYCALCSYHEKCEARHEGHPSLVRSDSYMLQYYCAAVWKFEQSMKDKQS